MCGLNHERHWLDSNGKLKRERVDVSTKSRNPIAASDGATVQGSGRDCAPAAVVEPPAVGGTPAYPQTAEPAARAPVCEDAYTSNVSQGAGCYPPTVVVGARIQER